MNGVKRRSYTKVFHGQNFFENGKLEVDWEKKRKFYSLKCKKKEKSIQSCIADHTNSRSIFCLEIQVHVNKLWSINLGKGLMSLMMVLAWHLDGTIKRWDYVYEISSDIFHCELLIY